MEMKDRSVRKPKITISLAILAGTLLAAGIVSTPLQVAADTSSNDTANYDTLKAGPALGAKIPRDLKTSDHQKQHQDFKSLAHSRGLVILFSGSLDW
jgi:hypothetical protein